MIVHDWPLANIHFGRYRVKLLPTGLTPSQHKIRNEGVKNTPNSLYESIIRQLLIYTISALRVLTEDEIRLTRRHLKP